MPIQPSVPVPFEVSSHALVIPGPRIFNSIAALPALLFNSWDALTAIFAQATSIAGAQTFGTLPNLRSVEYPNVTSIAANVTITVPNLQNLSFGALTSVTANVVATGGMLSEASINALLINLAAAAPTGRTFTFTGGTNAAPTGLGIVAKTALNVANTATTN